jgi:hypothetical protein
LEIFAVDAGQYSNVQFEITASSFMQNFPFTFLTNVVAASNAKSEHSQNDVLVVLVRYRRQLCKIKKDDGSGLL